MKKNMIWMKIVILFIVLILYVSCSNFLRNEWVIEDITYQAKDGLKIRAYLLKPKVIKGVYPAAVCIHHAWGNRDDYLKLFPNLASAGIITISPDLIRHKPSFNKERYEDIIDTINYIKKIAYVNSNKIALVTSSLSVSTGAIAISNDLSVKAFIMLSGPIINESARKMLTRNTDLAIFPIISKYETNNYYMMQEYLARNLNDKSRFIFLDNEEKEFKVEEHGTYLLDTHPEILQQIEKFLRDVFELPYKREGVIKHKIPVNTIEFKSTDNFPVFATFYPPANNESKTVLFYPPRYRSRLFYEDIILKLRKSSVGIMVPNNKRTCRYDEMEILCDREIKGAIDFLDKSKGIPKNNIIAVFPAAYFLAVEKLLMKNELQIKKVVLIGKPDPNAYIDPEYLVKKFSNIVYLNKYDQKKLITTLFELMEQR